MARFLLTLFRACLNTFIHSSGDDPLLLRAHDLLHPEPAQTHNVMVLIPIVGGIIVDILIRYVIGQVVMSLLILETCEPQARHWSVSGGRKGKAASRRLLASLSFLYHRGGIALLFNGFGAACTYWATHSSLTKLLSSLVLRPRLLRPLAYPIASILLAENHLSWTARTILPRDQVRYVPSGRDRRRWAALALPTLIHAAAESILSHLPALVEELSGAPPESVNEATHRTVIRSDIIVCVLMLALHLLLLLPSRIALISVEASLLPRTCETLVLSPTRQRGTRVREIFPTVELPLRTRKALQMVGVARLMWCLALHGKMCLWLLGVTALVHAAVYCL
ncbi:uncharacterized protein BO80DRAFT_350391 [Aspergillus ibericus CBS 121593]|uniref:Uncharacterized protein n=1 Tax=Aspergillus ibericus CBS 121593 TaxID=1448316 RepID=A0A395H754_9EURO|nr:hypothetical protein BO80DRAFT_350391 [Aspergillus ibericus CBS 121593]RAL03333.1 hypothetical protein BO80DRAFT_350391 [Aspergillus ibericus CBS 121593]